MSNMVFHVVEACPAMVGSTLDPAEGLSLRKIEKSRFNPLGLALVPRKRHPTYAAEPDRNRLYKPEVEASIAPAFWGEANEDPLEAILRDEADNEEYAGL